MANFTHKCQPLLTLLQIVLTSPCKVKCPVIITPGNLVLSTCSINKLSIKFLTEGSTFLLEEKTKLVFLMLRDFFYIEPFRYLYDIISIK